MDYVAYYRVSTQRQGISGLGLDAQRSSVLSFLNGKRPIAEYTDVESGSHNNRPQLLLALEYAKKTNTTLLVAKLDRLSRDLVFIATLQQNNVKFTCCDIPEANEFTIHLMAALAQMELRMGSQRTKNALKAAKARGVKLGTTAAKNFTPATRSLGPKARRDKAVSNPNNKVSAAHAAILRSQGSTLQQIANNLNVSGFKTSTGGTFNSEQVRRLLLRQKSLLIV